MISGANNVKNKELKKIVLPFEKKKLSFRDIQKITMAITELYRSKGYFVARAIIPIQNLVAQKQILKIKVLEGKYGELYLENKSLVKKSILKSKLNTLKDINIISKSKLQRTLLLINDTPGSYVNKSEIKPGKEIGTSDLIIEVKPNKKYNSYILADNYGTKYTGEHRIMLEIDVNSPFKIGDKFIATFLSSQNTGLLNGSATYSFPLNKNGLRGSLSYVKTNYELGDIYEELDAAGTSDSISFKVTYPMIRSQEENLNLYLDTSYNKLEDKIVGTVSKKDTLLSTIGAEYTKDYIFLNKRTHTKVNFSYTLGKLNFDNIDDKNSDKSGVNTQGTYSKINIDLEQDFALTNKIQWRNILTTQYAFNDKNLDGSEDLSIGGVYGVKYYRSGEQSAENGYIFNTELLYTLPSFKSINSSISLFYDIGRTFMAQDITAVDSQTLQDFGIGYYGAYKDFFINSHLAHNIAHDVSSEEDYSIKFLVQVGWVF